MQIYSRKLALSDWNGMIVHSFKLMASWTGLLMLVLTIVIGGGSISLIMGQVTMQGIGYFIAQPAVLSIYIICVLTRYRSGNPSLPVGKEIRNIILIFLMGISATVILLTLLWSVRIYIPAANAADIHPVMTNPPAVLSPRPFQPSPVNFISVFPVMYNIFSIATFSILVFTPFFGVVIGALVNSNAPLQRIIGLLFLGIFRNIRTLMLFSIFSISLMGAWSFGALQHESLIFLSVVPLVFLSVFSYVIAEQIFMPDKYLSKEGSLKGYNPCAKKLMEK